MCPKLIDALALDPIKIERAHPAARESENERRTDEATSSGHNDVIRSVRRYWTSCARWAKSIYILYTSLNGKNSSNIKNKKENI